MTKFRKILLGLWTALILLASAGGSTFWFLCLSVDFNDAYAYPATRGSLSTARSAVLDDIRGALSDWFIAVIVYIVLAVFANEAVCGLLHVKGRKVWTLSVYGLWLSLVCVVLIAGGPVTACVKYYLERVAGLGKF